MFGIHESWTNRLANRPGIGPATRPTRHRRRGRRHWAVEVLEGRTLLSTFTVNSLGDAGTGSGTAGDLRYVITQADQTAGDNTIDFAVTGTITLNSALPDLSNTTGLTDIEGPGASSLTVARSGAAGTPNFRIITVDANVQAKLVGLTITGGWASDQGGGIYNGGTMTIADSAIAYNSADGSGGGIFNNGTMTVTDSTIAYNSVGVGGGIGFGGGIFSGGALMVTDSTIANNSTGFFGEGGGIYNGGTMTIADSAIAYNSADGDGGGIFNNGTLTVTDSTIAYNSVGVGFGGGINSSGGTLTVTDSTIAYNSAGFGGGIICGGGTETVTDSTIAYNNVGRGRGGGIYSGSGTLTVTNSTIAYNSAGDGGGGIFNDGTITVTNSTIADNNTGSGGAGGGLEVGKSGLGGPTTFTLYNTIVALNTRGGTTADDIALTNGGAASPSSAYNLIGTGGSGGLTNGVNGNQVGVADPGLDPLGLQGNGGPTLTIALLPGSPAIDAGSNALAVDPQGNPLATDQRGPGFPRIVNGTVDIGAFEYNSVTPGDAGFEQPSAGPAGAYGSFLYDPTGTAWTYAGSAGVSANGSGFTAGNPDAPEGAQVGFLQQTGSFSQSVAGWAAGTYVITFDAAQRGNYQWSQQDFAVLVDGAVVGTFTPAGTSYQGYSTAAFAVTAGSHTIAFQGLNSAGGDNTAFLDAVAVVQVVPPVVGDAGFEQPSAGPAGADGSFLYDPTGTAWTYAGSAGVSANGTGFTAGNPDAPEGAQVGFLQQTGSFSQSVAGWAAGSYTISFDAAQRGNYQWSQQDFAVLVDGAVVGTFTPSGTSYRGYTTATFTVAAGSHTITFQGLDSAGGDNTAFLDAVSVRFA
jgi:hypothetical protein